MFTHVHTNSLGTLQPLMGVEQSACGVPPISSCCPSAAVIDITENMRAKIYTLCCKMGKREGGSRGVNNERERIKINNLSS